MKFHTMMVAVIVVLVTACKKNNLYNDFDESAKTRTITATFDKSTSKTSTTDGKTPHWTAGDIIWISDGTNTKTIELIENGQSPVGDQAVMSADKKMFTFTLPIPEWGETIYSVYPAFCATGTASNSGIGILIPSTQDGTFGSANICIATGTTTLSYKNAAAIIKVTGNETTNDYMFLTANSTSTPAISGSFTASINENTITLTPVTTKSTIKGTVQQSADSYYAIAACVATSLTFKARKSSEGDDKGLFATKSYTTGYTFATNTIYPLAMPEFSSYTEKIIIGDFSVSATKTIMFAPGNLWCDGIATKPMFYFEQNQYDYSVIAQETFPEIYNWNPYHISHFYYNTSEVDAIKQGYSSTGATNNDVFFTNDPTDQTKPNSSFIVEGQQGVWRTLSKDEWEYILNTGNVESGARTGNRFAKANYKGINGLIIFPDKYSGTTSGKGIASVNNQNVSYPTTSIPTETWAVMEGAGCVFLPVAGWRIGNRVTNIDSYGAYFTSTPYPSVSRAYFLHITSTTSTIASVNRDGAGCTVRLVRE